MFKAARAWDAASLGSILEASPELVSATDPKGRTALHMVCNVEPGGAALGEPYGIQAATALLKAGTKLDEEMPLGKEEGDFRATPLWFAVAWGENLPLAEFLLERGADSSYSLWAVVWRDDEIFCRALLKPKAEIEFDGRGRNADFLCSSTEKTNSATGMNTRSGRGGAAYLRSERRPSSARAGRPRTVPYA